MPVICVRLFVAAPAEVCFDLARDVDAHVHSTAQTRERAVDGVTSGLLELGDTVTWEAVHFGVRQRLTARITRFDRPRMFEDEMVRGAFHSFRHTHEFHPTDGGTIVVDLFRYVSPLGPLGWLADKLFLERYMRRFLTHRALLLKELAEAA